MTDGLPPSVAAMVHDSRAVTAPLMDFLAAYYEDDNIWWSIGCGHHLNLFESAIERKGALLTDVIAAIGRRKATALATHDMPTVHRCNTALNMIREVL